MVKPFIEWSAFK